MLLKYFLIIRGIGCYIYCFLSRWSCNSCSFLRLMVSISSSQYFVFMASDIYLDGGIRGYIKVIMRRLFQSHYHLFPYSIISGYFIVFLRSLFRLPKLLNSIRLLHRLSAGIFHGYYLVSFHNQCLKRDSGTQWDDVGNSCRP